MQGWPEPGIEIETADEDPMDDSYIELCKDIFEGHVKAVRE